MGISVSSTKTHQRLIEKRAARKTKRYQSNDPTKMRSSPLRDYEHNDLNKPTGYDPSKLHCINNFQNMEITLKTTDHKYQDYQKLSTPRDEPSEMYLKKDNIRQTSPSQLNQPLTIKHNKLIDNHVSGPSSMQEIDLSPKKINQQLQTKTHQGVNSINNINSIKQVISTSQKNISLQKEQINNENEEIEREIQKQKERKKIQQTKRYIESSSYPNKGHLSNAVYQQKSGPKIESILSQGLNSPIHPSKMSQIRQFPEVTTIKLKTEEEYLDQVKHSDRATGGSLMKNNSGKISVNNSLSTLRKKL